MPAAAVIPAPMAYLPIVAVEALVASVLTAGFGWPWCPSFLQRRMPSSTHPEECHVNAPDRSAFVAYSGARRPLANGVLRGPVAADCGLCNGAACTVGRAVKCIDPRGAPGGKRGPPVPSRRSRTKEWSAKPIRDRCSPFGQR